MKLRVTAEMQARIRHICVLRTSWSGLFAKNDQLFENVLRKHSLAVENCNFIEY